MLSKVDRWDELKRWERREVGQDLRRMGLSYREIASVIPVAKGTLSGWCEDIELSTEQKRRLESTRQTLAVRMRLGAERRMQARAHRASVRSKAEREAQSLLHDPAWVAGVVAYWAEGGKRKDLMFSNSDPDLVRLFIQWCRTYLDLADDRFTIALHLHSGQDEAERKRFWSYRTGLPPDRFRKTFVKQEGTGHRKQLLYNGTAQIRVTCGGELLQRVLGWIDTLRPPD